MTRTYYSRALLGTTSLIVVAMALSGARQAAAQDTTISSLITTGTSWDGTLAPASNFTITPTGTINTSDAYAVTVIGSLGVALGTFANSGVVIDSNATGSAINVGTVTISQFTNDASGTISATSRGVLVGSTGTIATLTNSGTITGDIGLQNGGSIGSIANTGTIFGNERGIYQAPGGRIGTITNDGLIAAGTTGSAAAGGIANGGSIVSVVNNGTILSSHSSGIGNNQSTSSIGTLVNNGLLGGVTSGIYNQGTFTQIINAGTISGPAAGIWNQAGTISSLTNSGTISGGTKAINLTGGTIGALSNSGTISGPVAVTIASGASLSSIANSGVIAGSILNSSANALTISGGTGLTFGTLTGSTLTNKGSIVNTLSNLVFSSGNLLLNDDINATGRTVSNIGATLRLDSTISVAGAFSQTAGSLLIDPTAGGIAATGAVDVSGGTVAASFVSTGNYLAGTYTLLSGSSLNLTGSTVTINNVTGLDRSSSTVANSLQLTVQNDYVGGTLSTLTNAAALTSSNTGLYVATTGRIGTMSNTGTLGGGQFGVNNRGTIGTLSNAGVITNANFTALWNQGSIGQLINTGTITNSSWAILNSGTLSTLTNSGVIAGAGNAVQNNGVITVVDNSGTMSGGSNALAGNFATIINSGVIKGNVNGNGGTIGTIIGGSNGTVGTFTGATNGTQGTIGISSNLTFASGALLLNDSVVAKNVASSSVTASNTGADITIATIVNVDAKFSQSAGSLNLGSAGKLVVTQTASFTGGTVNATLNDLSAAATYLVGSASGQTLVAGGAGSSYSGVTVNVSTNVNGLAGSGATSGNNLVFAYGNDYIGDTQVSISNSGTISGVNYPLYVANTGSIGTFVNSGSLIGALNGASNNGSIGSLTNSGLIQGGEKGFGNQSTVTNITNTATGTIKGGTAAGLQNDTSMGTLTNAGLISSGSAGVANYGTLGAIINSGTINGGPQAIYLDGNSTVGTVTNSGTITAPQTGIQIGGTLTALTNSGFIGGSNALNISGALGTFVNEAGGTIKGANAIYLSGSLGGLSNSGVIAGSITNTTASALTITGGSGTVTGTLTGANLSGKGTIINTASNLTFAGNLAVNDDINVGTNTVTNSGGALSFGSIISVTGNFAQSTGSLTLNGTGKLVVSQAASITGGTIVANGLSSTANYLHGSTGGTLVAGGAGSSYAGVTVTLGSAVTGVSASGTTSGNTLLLQVNNDYIGGTLASATNSDTITGVGSALYVAATGNITTYANSGGLFGLTTAAVNHGTIGTLSNSGTISGAAAGFANMAGGSIATLSNMGAISGGLGNFGIDNAGVIGTLINAQGGGINAPLTYSGTLPGTYLEYVFGTDHYGQMQVTGGTGTIGDFDIANGSTLTFGTTYAAVLSGVTTVEGQTSTVSGTFSLGLDHYDWNLVNSGSDVWDLVIASLFTAPDADDTVAVGQPVMAANFAQQFDGSVVLSQLSQLRLADGLGSSDGGQENPSLRISSMGGAAPVGNAFAILRGAEADYTAPNGGEAFGLATSGLTFGTGRYLENADANLGVFGSVSRTSSTGATASDRVDTKGIGLFGDKDLGGGFLLEGYLAYYKNAHEMTRLSDGDLYTASPDGASINGFARVSFSGLKMPRSMLLSPYVEMSYTRQSTDAYDENGDGGAAIHVDADSTTNTTTAIGAVFAASVPVGDGMTLSPMIDAAWVHASNNGARSLTTSFVGGADTFDQAIAGSDQDYGRIKASVGLQMTEKFNLSLGYSTQIENDDLDNLGEFRLEARLKF